MTVLRRITTLAAIATSSTALAFAIPAVATATPAEPVPAATATATPNDLLGVYQSALDALKAFGMDPFLYPTVAAFCSDSSTLGLVPAIAGAVPGPWPKTNVAIPGLDLTAVKTGQTMFTFVPYGIGADTSTVSGMQIAWLNLSNGRSGTAAMGPLTDIFKAMVPPEVPPEVRPLAERAIHDFFAAALPLGGVRAIPVDTGSGTVLAAVFGTVDNGGHPCFFLPTVGITSVR
ncbi:hypothetical protein [Nocardia australiensis]|uniref:hypothetical protein n=1 Tax=Nocardia australiensis TaxID=2887191 RepID=UPI001D14628A|nr:hypothetical protein [Nocardia australiensis]